MVLLVIVATSFSYYKWKKLSYNPSIFFFFIIIFFTLVHPISFNLYNVFQVVGVTGVNLQDRLVVENMVGGKVLPFPDQPITLSEDTGKNIFFIYIYLFFHLHLFIILFFNYIFFICSRASWVSFISYLLRSLKFLNSFNSRLELYMFR